ncbi:hypothetical protein M427DRAFT_321621 [Gonapodya prolifera JEL478]|uniref:Uncharacterized protein n=1 Tax=Gonapodya prolifera (strain JEL478) TaxID=1344416 RepID=A0A139AG53_GONPJ|nr:hypothetical protein M427DRAFT_321621 [Gonapodya prolifera JEL478]|eukprot:KXS15776.1 hypothetical protein M427DRAFT_321621 [Gonapodya prolifera JEL478]
MTVSSLTMLSSHMGINMGDTIRTLQIVGSWTSPLSCVILPPSTDPFDLTRDMFVPFPKVTHLVVRPDTTSGWNRPYLSEIICALASVPFELRACITSFRMYKDFSEPSCYNDHPAETAGHPKDPVGLLRLLCSLLPNLTDLGNISGRGQCTNYLRDDPDVLQPSPPCKTQDSFATRPHGPRSTISFQIHLTLTHLTFHLRSSTLLTRSLRRRAPPPICFQPIRFHFSPARPGPHSCPVCLFQLSSRPHTHLVRARPQSQVGDTRLQSSIV